MMLRLVLLVQGRQNETHYPEDKRERGDKHCIPYLEFVYDWRAKEAKPWLNDIEHSQGDEAHVLETVVM